MATLRLFALLVAPTLAALVTSERQRRQPLLVGQVGLGFLVPAETDRRRLLDAVGVDDDLLALDLGLGLVVLTVFAGYFKPGRRLVVAGLSAALGVVEFHPHSLSFRFHPLILRP